MPLIKSAKKKLRQDKKRTAQNKKYETAFLKLINKVKKQKPGSKSGDLLKKVYSALDKATKKRVIHKNKANRLKSRVSKLLKK